MADLFEGPELLDPMLTSAIGAVDTFSVAAIAGICDEAVSTVLGEAIVEELAVDGARLWLVVPWMKDVARGLQLGSIKGSTDVRTTSLLRLLGGGRVSEENVGLAGRSIDLAAALHLGDVLRLPSLLAERVDDIE
jgi:hypothetical protein